MPAPNPPADAPRPDAAPYGAQTWRTFAGTIWEGMEVVDAADKPLGTVAGVDGDRIMLAPHAAGEADAELEFLPLSLIDGIHDSRVLLAGRGDASFGLGAQP